MKTFLFSTLLLITAICSHAQNKSETFLFSLPDSKVSASLYRTIRLMDIREDTSNLGVIQKGAFNKQVKVIPEIPLEQQFQNLVAAANPSTAGDGELLLLLREFRFAEITKAMSEFGYCHFRASLFARSESGYARLQSIDTVVVIRAMDVTKKVLREGSEAIRNFITRELASSVTTDIVVPEDQLLSIDSLEKLRIPLYTSDTYKDGVYYNYASFARQEPDETGVKALFDKKNRFQGITYQNNKGQDVELKNHFYYAFVYQGKAWISGEFTCYPLEKRGMDFFFTGKVKNASSADVAAASLFFGIIGGLMASSATAQFELKIDHLSGGFKRIREMKE